MSFSTHSVSEVKSLSRVRLFATPWTVAYQAPLPVGFSRQEYWSRLPFPSPGDLQRSQIIFKSSLSLYIDGRQQLSDPTASVIPGITGFLSLKVHWI